GEPQVENDDLWLACRRLHHALLGCGGFEHLVAVGRECGPQEAPNLGFVFDDQDGRKIVCHSTPAGCTQRTPMRAHWALAVAHWPPPVPSPHLEACQSGGG